MRYNQSKIVGYSDGKRFGDGYFKWISPKDSQTNGKTTWQLALKKEFNENLTLRMTGGTYYRLLNMAEIAGDGAGIIAQRFEVLLERANGFGLRALLEQGRRCGRGAAVRGAAV